MRVRKIVLTGGPGAGKSVIAAALVEAMRPRLALVPEAATQVYTALGTRWDKLDLAGRRDAQTRMYRLQVAQEDRIARERPDRVLLLDRGTIDGAAYWPDGPEAFWRSLGTTHEAELARYDVVLWLETAAALGLYDGDASNATRFEDPAAAVASGKVLQVLWGEHPRLHHVGAFVSLEDKVAAVKEVIEGVI
jgi:nicotinamide riboside kinase